jgi:hypothetical protein
MKANPTSPKKSPPSPKPKRLRIYIGPNSRELGIFTYMRFRGDYPEHVVAALAENPALENYFVEFETWIKLRPPGSLPPRTKPLFPSTSKLPPIRSKPGSPFRVR